MDPPSRLKTLQVDPKHGELGVLISQNKKLVVSNSDQSALYEIAEVYLKEISWDEENTNRLTNDTRSDLKLTVTHGVTVSTTYSTEASLNATVGAEGKGLKAEIGGEFKVITTSSREQSKSEAIEYVLNPGETLYKYRRVYKLKIRKWWIAKYQNLERIVTEKDSYERTYAATVEDKVITDTRPSTTKFSGVQVIDMKPVQKEYLDLNTDAQYKRSQFSEMPEQLQQCLLVLAFNACVDPEGLYNVRTN